MNSVSAIFAFVYMFLLAQAHAVESADDVSVPWDSLNFQRSDLGRDDFEQVVNKVFAPFGGWQSFLRIEDGGVWISTDVGKVEDQFRPFVSIKPFFDFANKASSGLNGLRIALDPGHIGGAWGEMEERSIAMGGESPVQEGDLTLATALRLRERLEALGATVFLTRDRAEPVTSMRPADFLEEATAYYENEIGITEAQRSENIRKRAELLFYRKAEIEARSELLNTNFKPDLTLALHYNATGWEDPENPELVDANNGHVLVHGSYLPSELEEEGMRFQLLSHISKQYYKIEIPLATAIAKAMVEETGLPPYHYEGGNAKLLEGSEYVWSRNLLANRIFDSPVVYLEPWILNSKEVYPWAKEGDYEGVRSVDGVERLSLPRVYADFVMAGLLEFYTVED